jgi:hypothetical protein
VNRHPFRSFLLVLGPVLLCALFLLVYPVYVIWPFRRQGSGELLLALAVTRYRLLPEIACAVVALAALVLYWRRENRRWRRALAILPVLLVLAIVPISRVNIYELMFHPLDAPRFAAAAKTPLAADEKVIAVAIAGDARAYPIRGMSYHHVVNDTLGGVPLVATY